jgi:DNA-binding MarR family transcriptional regulator
MRPSKSNPKRSSAAVDEIERFLGAWFAIRQIIQAANFNRFHKAGLSATQFMILNILPEPPDGLTIGALAAKANLAPATIVKTVDTLQERGMVARVQNDADRRSVIVKITARGSKLQNTAAGQFRDQIAELFRNMPRKDRDALVRGLESLVQAAHSK